MIREAHREWAEQQNSRSYSHTELKSNIKNMSIKSVLTLLVLEALVKSSGALSAQLELKLRRLHAVILLMATGCRSTAVFEIFTYRCIIEGKFQCLYLHLLFNYMHHILLFPPTEFTHILHIYHWEKPIFTLNEENRINRVAGAPPVDVTP